jgi:hypothetical protein
VRVAHAALDVNIDQRKLDALGGSRDTERENLILIEDAI